MQKTLPVVLLLLSLLAASVATARPSADGKPGAAESAADYPLGDFADDLPTQVDPTKHYTLYVPASYRPGSRLPVLLILDPSGRARMAASLFRPAADRYGWILVSANDIRSDTAWEPNWQALSAMWQEMHRYPIDARRIYTAGLDGGALLAWVLGQNTDALAGMISAGSRLQQGISEEAPSPLWGAVGSWDFNYGEMRHIGDLLSEKGVPHWLEIFPGPHTWMPEELATQSVGWMELQAMKTGRREADPALVDQLWKDWIAEAERREAAGDELGALRQLRQIEATFRGLRDDAAELRTPIERLEASREVARQLRIEQHEDAEVERYVREKVPLLGLALTRTGSTDFAAFEANNRFGENKMTEGRIEESRVAEDRSHGSRGADVTELRRRLDLKRLRDKAEGSDWEAVAARRKLQFVAAQASVYLPGEWMAQGEWRAAQTVLQIATEVMVADVAVETPRVWFDLARCASRLNDEERAVEALQKAVESGWNDAEALRSNEDFTPLRERDDFRALVAEMERPSTS